MTKNVLLAIGAIIAAIVVLGVFVFVGNGVDLANYAFWEPKKQAAERHVFENTPSYIQGKNQDLAKYHHEWVTDTSSESRQAIEALVRQQFGSFDKTKIEDQELAAWLGKCLNN